MARPKTDAAGGQRKGEPQKQLSKEFVREWLIANNFMGKEGQTVPEMSNEWINTISSRYVELFEKVTGEKFVMTEERSVLQRIESNFMKSLNRVGLQ